MEPKQAPPSSKERDNRGRFTIGHKKRGGRKRGTLNQLTVALAVMQGLGDPQARVDFIARLVSEDERIRLKLLTFVVDKQAKALYRAEVRAGLWPTERKQPLRHPELSGLTYDRSMDDD